MNEVNEVNNRNIQVGTNYIIYNEKLGIKYFITATAWNIEILRYIADSPNQSRSAVFKDWFLGEECDNKMQSILHELPLRYKEFLGIDERAHGGGYKMKNHGNPRSRRRKRSRRVKSRGMNARRRSIANGKTQLQIKSI